MYRKCWIPIILLLALIVVACGRDGDDRAIKPPSSAELEMGEQRKIEKVGC